MPLDGSPASGAALPVARAVAALLGTHLHLLHVADAPLTPQELVNVMGLRSDALSGLVLDWVPGPTVEAILHAAAEDSCQLVVMGTHGWGLDPKRALGHVAEAVLRRSRCPLLVVRPEVGARFAAEHRRIERLLLPLNGAPTTADALAPAIELVCGDDTEIDVLHVVGPAAPKPEERGAFSVPQYMDQPHHAWDTWAREFVARFCACLDRPPKRILVAAGEPGQEILRVARERGSDLIVLAWKGSLNGGRARTVRTVLRQAPCPILFVRTSAPSKE